jgi:hypothetical protein
VFPVAVRSGTLTLSDVEGEDVPLELRPLGAHRFLILMGGAPLSRAVFSPAPAGGMQEMRLSALNDETKAQAYARVPAGRLPAAALDAFAGDYRSDELDVTYSVTSRYPHLVVHLPGKPDFVLEPMGDDVFAGSVAGIVRFLRNDGTVTGFTMTRRTVRGMAFERVSR